MTELLVDVEALDTAPGGLDHHGHLRSCFLRSWFDVKPPAAQTHKDLCVHLWRGGAARALATWRGPIDHLKPVRVFRNRCGQEHLRI